jgi:hypothetical protein
MTTPQKPTDTGGEQMAPYGPDHPDYPNAPADWNRRDVMLRCGAPLSTNYPDSIPWVHPFVTEDGLVRPEGDVVAYVREPDTGGEHIAGAGVAIGDPQPMQSAPKDKAILVWWPIVSLDDDCNLTDNEIGGAWLVTEWNGGTWLEPDVLNCLNSAAFDDEEEYAEMPRCWLPLPEPLTVEFPA